MSFFLFCKYEILIVKGSVVLVPSHPVPHAHLPSGSSLGPVRDSVRMVWDEETEKLVKLNTLRGNGKERFDAAMQASLGEVLV